MMMIIDEEMLKRLNHQWDSLEWNFFKNTAKGISQWNAIGWNTFRNIISKIDQFVNKHRAFTVFLIAIFEIAIIYYNFDNVINTFTGGTGGTGGTGYDSLAKLLSSTLPILVAAPIAFFIWHFRDLNKREDIKTARIDAETAREDLVQKDFHEVQRWATEDGKGDGEGNSALQIAAIHQLKPYAVGEHGDRFRRPAYEIYYALLEEWQPKEPDEEDAEIIIPSHIKAIHTVFREKGKEISTDMEEINLSHAHLPNIDLTGVNLLGANLQFAKLAEANLQSANLFGSNLHATELRGANFKSANLQGADLKSANFFIEHIIHATNWNGPDYDDDEKGKIYTFYERLKEKGEGGYWDPYTGKYVEETKKKE